MSKLCDIKRMGSSFASAKGFTLIEILIVIGIMALTSGMFIGYNRSGDEQIMLFKDQATLISAINRAKAFAQQRYRLPSASQGGVYNPKLDACAFGIYIPAATLPQKFYIFADKAQVGQPCINIANDGTEAPTTTYNYDSPPDEIIETLELDKRMKFTAGMGSSIVFIPPNLELKITPSAPQLDIAIQSITSTTRPPAIVTISSGGQITTR